MGGGGGGTEEWRDRKEAWPYNVPLKSLKAGRAEDQERVWLCGIYH
jgi:hypothetical protein